MRASKREDTHPSRSENEITKWCQVLDRPVLECFLVLECRHLPLAWLLEGVWEESPTGSTFHQATVALGWKGLTFLPQLHTCTRFHTTSVDWISALSIHNNYLIQIAKENRPAEPPRTAVLSHHKKAIAFARCHSFALRKKLFGLAVPSGCCDLSVYVSHL